MLMSELFAQSIHAKKTIAPIVLRDYQERDIAKITIAFAQAPEAVPAPKAPSVSKLLSTAIEFEPITEIKPPARILYVSPTGSGKTVLFAAIIERAVAKGGRILVLTHRREILRQTSLKLSMEHGLIQAGLHADPEYSVQIASVDTLFERVIKRGTMELPPADLVIIDECHHVPAMKWQRILGGYPLAKFLGTTATACRADNRGLGSVFNIMIIGPSVSELQEAGHLVRVIYFAPSEPDLRGVGTTAGDYNKGELSKRMNRDDLVGDIIVHCFKLGEGRRTIVYCVDLKHGEHVCQEFVKAGVKAEIVSGKTPKAERDAVLKRLESGETTVVVNCMVLTEGWDCPPVSCVILARPTKSFGLFRQMAGRGLRPWPGKENLILIDHSGAVFRHGFLEDPVEWSLDPDKKVENKAHAARGKDNIRKELECSQCESLRKGGEACPNCGLLPKRPAAAIIFADGDLRHVDPRSRKTEVPKVNQQQFYSELLSIQQSRGYKRGWAAYQYKKKFGFFPPWAWNDLDPVPPSPATSSWVRSRQIAFAKGRGARR